MINGQLSIVKMISDTPYSFPLEMLIHACSLSFEEGLGERFLKWLIASFELTIPH